MPGKKASTETRSAVLKKAALRRLPRRIRGRGHVIWPAVPSLIDHYLESLAKVFASLERKFSRAELDQLRQHLSIHLNAAFEASPHSKIKVEYHTEPPPDAELSYEISHRVISIVDEYDDWIENREPPLFGAYPDAKVMQAAASLGESSSVRILDVGAGTGRNTLALARAGFSVDAVEIAPSLAAILRDEASKASLPIRVFEGDALYGQLGIEPTSYRLVVLSQVIASHCRGVMQLRTWLERSAAWLAPGGMLLFSCFLAAEGYQPSSLERELSEVMWCPIFTRSELEEAREGLPLTLVSDESMHDFEQQQLDACAWPPTGWFSQWTRGMDLFDLPAERTPVEAHWLAYQRKDPS